MYEKYILSIPCLGLAGVTSVSESVISREAESLCTVLSVIIKGILNMLLCYFFLADILRTERIVKRTT